MSPARIGIPQLHKLANTKLHSPVAPSPQDKTALETCPERKVPRTAKLIGIPLVVAGSTSKFLRYLLQDFNAKNPKHPKKA